MAITNNKIFLIHEKLQLQQREGVNLVSSKEVQVARTFSFLFYTKREEATSHETICDDVYGSVWMDDGCISQHVINLRKRGDYHGITIQDCI